MNLIDLDIKKDKKEQVKPKKTFEELVEEIKPYLLNPDEVNT